MNRTLKIMFLLLFISSISFLSAQEGRDSEGKGTKTVVKDKSAGGGNVTPDGPNAAVPAKNMPTKGVNVGQPDGYTKGEKPAEDKKGWLARLFGGKDKKAKKESDPE